MCAFGLRITHTHFILIILCFIILIGYSVVMAHESWANDVALAGKK